MIQGFRLTLLLVLSFLLTGPARAQDAASVLFKQLNQRSTTDRAMRDILNAAGTDPSVRQYAVQMLPQMIDQVSVNEVWINAVRLSGKLKVSEAIPALTQAFSRNGGISANTTMTQAADLEDDPVAKAFSEIGEPAVTVVSGLLRDGDRRNRKRAVRILLNMHSPASRDVLKAHLEHENDPGIRRLIENNLR